MASTTVDIAAKAKVARVVAKHHWLVRATHWLNIPILLGLGLSGLSIYWAAPVYKHTASLTDQSDYLADIGHWVVGHVPWERGYTPPDSWFYNHASLGTGLLAPALRLHWLFAYLFMANGLFYLVGLWAGGGYKALLPRRTDLADSLGMVRYYLGLVPAKLLRRAWKHPQVASKYNALQRAAYFFMPVAGLLSVLTGWAIHKPAQLWWLAAVFGGYDWARAWHFWLLWIFAAFVIPHVVLVLADGWDTLRSMVVGWSERIGASHDG